MQPTADADNWIKIFTFLGKEEISNLVSEHEKNPSARLLQKKLAEEVTSFVHGREAFEKALETTTRLFSNTSAPASSLAEDDLLSIEGIVKAGYNAGKLETGVEITDLLTETAIFKSKGEAKKMIQNGGVSINREKIVSPQHKISGSSLLHGKFLLVQVGKKNYYLVTAE